MLSTLVNPPTAENTMHTKGNQCDCLQRKTQERIARVTARTVKMSKLLALIARLAAAALSYVGILLNATLVCRLSTKLKKISDSLGRSHQPLCRHLPHRALCPHLPHRAQIHQAVRRQHLPQFLPLSKGGSSDGSNGERGVGGGGIGSSSGLAELG